MRCHPSRERNPTDGIVKGIFDKVVASVGLYKMIFNLLGLQIVIRNSYGQNTVLSK